MGEEKLPEWFPRTMEELYRPDPGQQPSIGDLRVAASHGGGACPEQHWGVLTDGRVFYFRYRHGIASLVLAPAWFEASELPARDLRVTMAMWDEAYESGQDLPILWLGRYGFVQASEEDDGSFYGDGELRDRTFAGCLDQIESEPFDEEGWELLRKADKGDSGMGMDVNKSPGAWHGIATNGAYPVDERLAAALRACDLYLVRLEAIGRHLNNVSRAAAATESQFKVLNERLEALHEVTYPSD